MHERTRRLWDKQDHHHGDRHRLFTAVAATIEADTVLYPGSYVDVAPSFVWPSVTYVDIDRRAQQFFDDKAGVEQLLAEHDVDPITRTVRFIKADYSDPLDLDENEFDLLISLYAGFVSEACTRHLRVGGTLLVNPSHGDAAMASIDPRYRVCGVVTSRPGSYAVDTRNLDEYLVPKSDVEVTENHFTPAAGASLTPSRRSRTSSNGSPDHLDAAPDWHAYRALLRPVRTTQYGTSASAAAPDTDAGRSDGRSRELPLSAGAGLHPSIVFVVSGAAAAHDDDQGLVILPIDEALKRARPWKRIGDTGLEDVTDDEWDAFIESLTSK